MVGMFGIAALLSLDLYRMLLEGDLAGGLMGSAWWAEDLALYLLLGSLILFGAVVSVRRRGG
jgi:hypothetical protein